MEGELIVAGANACGDHRVVRRRFNAADWPVDTSIVYFQGEHDPATPLWQAHYHFEHQPQAPRYFVRIDRAAHAALSVTLNVRDCPARLWDAITNDLKGLAGATARCDALERAAHVVLEYRAPELAISGNKSAEFTARPPGRDD